jgi:hypothetical protein
VRTTVAVLVALRHPVGAPHLGGLRIPVADLTDVGGIVDVEQAQSLLVEALGDDAVLVVVEVVGGAEGAGEVVLPVSNSSVFHWSSGVTVPPLTSPRLPVSGVHLVGVERVDGPGLEVALVLAGGVDVVLLGREQDVAPVDVELGQLAVGVVAWPPSGRGRAGRLPRARRRPRVGRRGPLGGLVLFTEDGGVGPDRVVEDEVVPVGVGAELVGGVQQLRVGGVGDVPGGGAVPAHLPHHAGAVLVPVVAAEGALDGRELLGLVEVGEVEDGELGWRCRPCRRTRRPRRRR